MIGIVPTAHFRGRILDDTDAPVSNLGLFANGASAMLAGTTLGATDTDGFFDLPVFGGVWTLFFNSQGLPDLIFPSYTFNITNGIDVTNTIIARKLTGSISGYVRDQTNGAVPSLTLTVSTTVNSTSYNQNGFTDSAGNYSVAVFDGTWTVSLPPFDLLSRDYNPANPVNVTVPPTNGVANFSLYSIGPANGAPGIVTTSLPDAFLGQAYYQTVTVTNADQYLSWLLTSGTLPDGLNQDSFLGKISGTPTSAGLFSFTVQVTDQRGSNATSVLSINVRSVAAQSPRLDLPALLPGNIFNVRVTGTAGQSYTLEFATALTSWTGILTTNASGDVFYLQDTHATNATRFYRLKVNP